MNRENLGSYFVDENNNIYQMIGYCEVPSITLKDIVNKRQINFAEGSPLAKQFHKLIIQDQ